MSVSVTTFNPEQLVCRFDEMRPLLLALANESLCRDIQSKVGASDIVQQTMIEAFQHAQTFKPEDDRHIFNWLSKILLHNLRDVAKAFRLAKKRSVHRERRLASEGDLVDTKAVTHPLEVEEDLALLGSALNRLPHAHQQILTWRYHQQLTFREIAELVGRNEDAVRMQVKRAIRRLAREMHIYDHPSSC